MARLQRLALALVLIPVGLLAGIHFMMLIGIIPALQHLPLYTYVVTWQTLDHFMRLHMPAFSAVMMVLYLLTLICCANRWRTWFFWALLGCFALNVSEIAFTVTHQLPINRAVQALDPAHLVDIERVQQLREVSVHNFRVREWLAISSFICLTLVVVMSKLPTKTTPGTPIEK